MGFDRNPHVAKAVAAEQKARDAGDVSARTLAWREAARLWERAAERELSDKRKTEYTRNAESARDLADGTPPSEDADNATTQEPTRAVKASPSKPSDPRGFN